MHAVLFAQESLSIDILLERLSNAAKSHKDVQIVGEGDSVARLIWDESGWSIRARLVTGNDAAKVVNDLSARTDLENRASDSNSLVILAEDELPAECSDTIFNALVMTYDFFTEQFPSDPIYDCRNDCFLENEPLDRGLEELIELARHPDPEKRSVAADELGRCDDPTAQKVLLQLGADPDSGVRMMVAIALMCADQIPEGGKELLEQLCQDTDPDVRAQAESTIDFLS